MPLVSPPDVLALTVLRLRSLAEPTEVAFAAGLTDEQALVLLEQFQRDGFVSYRAGALSGWALTRAGRREIEARLAGELDIHDLRSALSCSYEAFLAHNTELLELCTAWQLRYVAGQPTVNQHDDPVYDDNCIERLTGLHRAVTPILADAGARIVRFAPYPTRLERALSRVQAGEFDYFTSPGVDSYHTVWFELHEHLLATLGIERATENADGSSASTPRPSDPTRGSAGASDLCFEQGIRASDVGVA